MSPTSEPPTVPVVMSPAIPADEPHRPRHARAWAGCHCRRRQLQNTHARTADCYLRPRLGSRNQDGSGETFLAARDRPSKIFVTDKLTAIQLPPRSVEHALLDAAEQGQRRMAHDFHDGLCQTLAGASFRAQVAGQILGDHPCGGDVRELAEILLGAIGEARSLARGLHPVELETSGLAVALEGLAQSASAFVPCEAHATTVPEISCVTSLHLFRVAQEAVRNTLAHASASRIDITLRTKLSALILEVRDDGRGFDAQTPALAEGLGLSAIRYRAHALGATLTIRSAPGRGTAIQCRLPLRTP